MDNNRMECKKLRLDPGILVKARDGDAISQLALGKAYFNAIRFENNCRNAFEWFSRSAEQGNMEAQFLLANMYALGQEAEMSHVDAYKWYTRAALQGYKKASIRIHNLYQQDKKMHCRGKLNSEEELRLKEYNPYSPKYYYRELNEQRLDDHRLIASDAINYYANQLKKYKMCNHEDLDNQLNLAFLYHYGYGVKKNIILAIEFYKKAAEKGHRDAQYHLAVLYQQNTNIKFNHRMALRWYRASATSGNIAAQNSLAYFYEKGLSIEVDNEGAFYWYTKAASAGNSDAQLNLGRIHRKGQAVEQSFLEAAKWYKLAASQGNNAAQNSLNQLLQRGKLKTHSGAETMSACEDGFSSKTTLYSVLQSDINKLNDSSKTKKLIKLVEHALMTDGNAMYEIGLKYYNGEDFSQDKDTGFQWIKKAAKAGNQEAELKIAKMYEDGDTVEQDYHESSKWTIKLTKKKNSKAQNNLGILYKNGHGVRKDPLEASKWFIKSGDQGNRDALYQFGVLKFDGDGVRKDQELAFKYFYRSAVLGNRDSIFRLGYMYENGECVEKNESKAVEMYKSSAKLGYIHAQFRLGRIYEEGCLTQKDLAKSLEYYTMAANSGGPSYQNELAIKYLNGVFDDPNFTKAYALIKQAPKNENLIEGIIFKKPVIHFSKIDDISKIIDMLILSEERGVEHVAYELGYAHEFGVNYVNDKENRHNQTDTIKWYYSQDTKPCHTIKIYEKNKEMQYISRMKALKWYGSGNEKELYSHNSGFYYRSWDIMQEQVFYTDYIKAMKWYRSAANIGDHKGYYQLGTIYELGRGVKKDIKIAFNYYSQAFEKGNGKAAYSLACMYLSGNGVSQDLVKAFHLFSEASYMGHAYATEMLVPSPISNNLQMLEAVATLGHVAIQYQLGKFYESENDLNSFKWFSLAAQGGSTDAHYRLGLFYEEGRGTNINYLKAMVFYEKASKRDHQDAFYRLGRLYHHGKAVKCDYLKSHNYYARAAKLQHIDAQRILDTTERSIIHSCENNQEDVVGTSSSEINDAILLLKSVANHGNIELQYSLGVFYYRDGDNQDYEEAFLWFKMAADNNHVEAIFHLGLLYEKGLGVEQEYNKSFELFHRANIHGSHYGLYRLGIAYHYGYGVDRCIEDALSYYIKAAELGNHESQYTLGLLYKNGELVQEDTIKALVWFTKAYQNGNPNAIDSLLEIYDDPPYEYYFHKKLFQKFSKMSKDYENDNTNYDNITYGHIYFTLGKMYFNGLGTTKDYAKSLSHFVKARDYGSHSDAYQYIPLEFKVSSSALQNDYMEMLQAYYAITDELDGDHLYQLGMLYQDGAKIYSVDQNTAEIIGPIAIVQKDEVMAFQYIQLASKKGNSEAQCHLGQMYLEGNGIQQNYQEARKWFNSAAKLMRSYDCYQQGMNYYEGVKVEKSFDISLIFIKAAAKQKHVDAQAQLTMMSLQNNGIEKDQKDTIEEIQDSVESMDPGDCYHLGMEFYYGTKVDKNYEISLIYLRKAADHNHAMAQAQLGAMYYQGHGVDKSNIKATDLMEKSLVEMNSKECYNEGMKFYEGTEVDINYEIALIYLRKAAEKNYGLALAQLAVIYFQGNGVEKDFGEAIEYTEQAIIEMTSGECYDQGMKFYSGFEVDTNYELSIKYLRSAAIKKYGAAQAQIVLMYLQGHGVEKSLTEAMLWIKESIKEMYPGDCYKQGMKFYKDTEVVNKYEIALIYIRKAAGDSSIVQKQGQEQERAQAQAQLGLMYLRGDGVEKDYEKAMNLIKKSVNNMWMGQCYFIGMKFYRAIELDRNYEISLLYLKKGAKEGDPHSQAQLAYMYFKGIGMDEDFEQASRWRNRIKNGYPKYYSGSLAQIYHYDEEGIQDFSKALEYYQKELYGHKETSALRGIGLLYEHGDGVDRDYKKAMEYYKRSANDDTMCAYYNLGLLYYFGRGVNQDYINALSWFARFLGKNPGTYESNDVFIRDDSNDILTFSGYVENKYSLQPESIFFGATHYYLGLMHTNGYGTVQNNDRAQAHFKKSLEYGIKRASEFIKQ